MSTKKHYATRAFKDAGTERAFEMDAELTDVSAGELANYVNAGLATTDKPETSAPTPAAKTAS